MRTLLHFSLIAVLGSAPLAAEEGTTPAPLPDPLQAEKAVIDGIPVPLKVSNKKELTIPTPKVESLDHSELWTHSWDGKAWSEWEKFGTDFTAATPINWAPPEGIWEIYIRPFTNAQLAAPAPSAATPPLASLTAKFIIDRTPPVVTLIYPPPKAILRGNDTYTIKWEATDLYLRSAPVTIEYSRDGQQWDVIAANIPNKGSLDWVTPINMTVSGQLKIEVRDKADNVGTAVNGDLMIDSIKPSGMVVAPQISNSLTVPLQLDIKDGGPAGLESAQLWVSQDDGTSWTEGPWIKDPKQIPWKAPSDGTYRLAILAIDRAGNKSEVPAGKGPKQFVLVVDTTPPLVQLANAIGIQPAANGGNAVIQRAFKKGDRVQVQFVAKDVNLAANSAAIYLQTTPGNWVQLAAGQPLDQPYRFALPDIATKTARIKVTAADLAGNIGEATADETFEIQNKLEIGDSTTVDPLGK